MAFNFVVDRVVRGKIYPALAQHQAEPYTPEWRTFGQHWPFTTPLRIQEYCELHEVKINTYSIHDKYPADSYYPICLGFFDFEIDFFKMLPPDVYRAVTNAELQILFLYHEGDNPKRIKTRLDELARLHALPTDCYVFVSSNSAAEELPNFVAFQDSELWYYQRNHIHSPLKIHTESREREFTCLNRIHKWWRAAGMADLKSRGILDNSYWSYCEAPYGDDINDCPIQIDLIEQLRYNTKKFVDSAPYFSDELSQEERNDHSHLEPKYFVNAYCNIVLETQFDYDQSNGLLLSEKTFKPLKHGQLFFIAGGAGSLQVLRKLGYRVFDDILDNSYDLEMDHTMRWIKFSESVAKAQQAGIANLFEKARADIEYNQHLFMQRKHERLNTLIEQINDKHR